MQDVKVSICIPCHNQYNLLADALHSCWIQTYKNIEIIVLDDASTEPIQISAAGTKTYRSDSPSGTGGAFNKAINYATGSIVILLCADDMFTDKNVIADIINEFNKSETIVHVSRYYYQFVDGDKSPVRAWRCNNIIELANNPSGLAFRSSALNGHELSNKMFVEASTLVSSILKEGTATILQWDTVAVRIHKSISRTPGYYKKMWNSSPVEEWSKVGWKTNDFTHLIQVGVNFEKKAVAQEAAQFLNVNPLNFINPCFWFFFLISLWIPSAVLYKIPEIYRATWGKWTTREVKRA